MNKDDIIRMAHEAGLHIATDVHWMPIIGLEYAQKFAALVAAAEREACAKVCENYPDPIYVWTDVKAKFADAIRARGQE